MKFEFINIDARCSGWELPHGQGGTGLPVCYRAERRGNLSRAEILFQVLKYHHFTLDRD